MAIDVWLASLSAPTDAQHAESSAADNLLKKLKRQVVQRLIADSGQFTVRGCGRGYRAISRNVYRVVSIERRG